MAKHFYVGISSLYSDSIHPFSMMIGNQRNLTTKFEKKFWRWIMLHMAFHSKTFDWPVDTK
jgi:hypothetical protein